MTRAHTDQNSGRGKEENGFCAAKKVNQCRVHFHIGGFTYRRDEENRKAEYLPLKFVLFEVQYFSL